MGPHKWLFVGLAGCYLLFILCLPSGAHSYGLERIVVPSLPAASRKLVAFVVFVFVV